MDLLSIDSLSDGQIETILDRADHWFEENRAGRSTDLLKGKLVFNLFYEVSTRTAMSFATASHRLGSSVVALPVEQSSIRKGETFADTAQTLNAMRPDALVIRHRENGAPAAAALIMDCPVINAGDGTNEHPTQALLDAATIRRRFGRDGWAEGRDLRRYPPQPGRAFQRQAPAATGDGGTAGGTASNWFPTELRHWGSTKRSRARTW